MALSWEAQCLAAVFAAGDGAALSEFCAARLCRISRFPAPVISVVAPRKVRIAGVRVHRCARLQPRDLTCRDGIPVTTVPRTLVDLTDHLTAEQLANVIYEAAFRGWFSVGETRAAMARANGRHHLDRLDEAIDMHLAGSAGTKSEKEDIFQALIGDRFPKPAINVRLFGFEVDCVWTDHRLVVEVDGGGHDRPRARRKDARLDRAMKAGGYDVLRFTDFEIEREPETVRAALHGVMRTERRR
jgi:very-short-patch-repair endonuclease